MSRAGMHIGGTFGWGRTAYDSVLWFFGATPSYNFKTWDDGYPYSTSHIPSIMHAASYEYGKTYRSINWYDYINTIYNPQTVSVWNFTSNTNDWLYFDFVYATKYKIPDHPAFTQYPGRDGYHTAVEIALKDNPNINYSIDSGDTIATLDKSRKWIVTFISLYNTKETTILQQLESIVKNF